MGKNITITSGEWYAQGGKRGPITIYAKYSRSDLVEVATLKGDRACQSVKNSVERVGNAFLITAAPEMYFALLDYQRHFKNADIEPPITIQNAIFKAENGGEIGK